MIFQYIIYIEVFFIKKRQLHTDHARRVFIGLTYRGSMTDTFIASLSVSHSKIFGVSYLRIVYFT